MISTQAALSVIRRAASSVDNELDLMLALSEHVIAEPALDELVRRLCIFAAELIEAELLMVPILNSTRDSYEYIAATGADADVVLGASLPVTTGLCGWVLRHQQPVLHGESHDLPVGDRPKWEPGMQSSLLVPLLSRGLIIGGLSAVGKRGGGSFTQRDLKLLTLFANHTSVALSNAQAVAHEQQTREELIAAKLRAEEHARELSRAMAEQKRLESELLQSQKMESMGRLAGGIAHDFNNLLTTISGNLELVDMDLAADHPIRPLLQDVSAAAARAAELTQQLLTFARRQVVKPRPTSLTHAIAEALSMLQRVLPRYIHLDSRIAPNLHQVLADPGQLNQIIMNLVLNAQDALAHSGRIQIEAHNQHLEEDELSGHDGVVAAGDYVVLAVEDDGVGISPELMPRLFEPFVTTKKVGEGTGLGLATCYGIVKQIGGAIRVRSELGAGARFELFLPHCDDDQLAPEDDVMQKRRLPPKTIFVAEDEDALRTMVCNALRHLGHTVHSAPDGARALAQLQAMEGRVDLLITDVVMPDLDGWELVQRVNEHHPHMRVLFMSGYPADHYQDLMDHVEHEHFLHKPFGPAQLAEQLHRIYAPKSGLHTRATAPPESA